MGRVSVGIINATGYVGAELARILSRHPGVTLRSVTGRTGAGQKLGDIFPHLNALGLEVSESVGDVDFVFSALPHRASGEAVLPLLRQGTRVVDASADFRLKDAADYARWYEHQHPAPDWLEKAVYGLPELHRDAVRGAQLVANPGCYPTAAVLALAPAVQAGITSGHIVVDSKSGVSGAGRTLALSSHFSEVDESVAAYGVDGHRHLPEMNQELSALAPGGQVSLTFVPHLIPMTRGMLSTCYATLANPATTQDRIRGLYRDFYRDAPFVQVTESPPQSKHTLGSNFCLVYPFIDRRTGTLVVVSCLDNLVKGGAGQAVQNMNLMLGLPETSGLDALALFP